MPNITSLIVTVGIDCARSSIYLRLLRGHHLGIICVNIYRTESLRSVVRIPYDFTTIKISPRI